jgi:DNA repair photolyase
MKKTFNKNVLELLKNAKIQIYPVIKAPDGEILDGEHRKKIDPNWKEQIIDVKDELEKLLIKLQANAIRRNMSITEKRNIVLKIKELLEAEEKRPISLRELEEITGISEPLLCYWIRRDKNLSTELEDSVKYQMGKELRGLTKSGVEWCDYEISIYRGCYHNCSYCYAKRMNDRYHWIPDWTNPIPKEIRWKDLANSVNSKPKGRIFFCSVCDAYQPIEKEKQIARKMLQEILIPSHHLTLILTKSNLVIRDYDIIKGHNNVHVGFTLTSLEKNKFEPNSSSPEQRIEALKLAKESNITTFVSIEPWIPQITNPIEIISKTNAYVDYYIIGSLQYSGKEQDKREIYKNFAPRLFNILQETKKGYYLKEELLHFLGHNWEWKW